MKGNFYVVRVCLDPPGTVILVVVLVQQPVLPRHPANVGKNVLDHHKGVYITMYIWFWEHLVHRMFKVTKYTKTNSVVQ